GYCLRAVGGRVPGGGRLEGLLRQGLATEPFYLANGAFDAGDPALRAALLAEAGPLWPGIRGQRGWRRLRLKRAVGGRLWRVFRSVLRPGRRPAAAAKIGR